MLLRGMSTIADLPRVLKVIVGTGKHYKFRYKHDTEVSQDKRNCLIELQCLEDSACFPGTYSSGMIVHQIRQSMTSSTSK
jgi:hypothetical protein